MDLINFTTASMLSVPLMRVMKRSMILYVNKTRKSNPFKSICVITDQSFTNDLWPAGTLFSIVTLKEIFYVTDILTMMQNKSLIIVM